MIPAGERAAGDPVPVAVVIVTYQSERDLDDCLRSLRSCDRSGMSLDIIIVDNASSDGTSRRVRSEFPEVLLLERPTNEGFAAANNVGIRLAAERGARFVYLLNPDTVVERGFLREALAVARADPGLGGVQSLLLLASDRARVNTWGNEVHFLGFGYCGGLGARASEAPDAAVEIASASGAAALFPVDALLAAGLFDADLFLYQEDMDLSWRLRLSGWRLALAPRSVVYHKYAFSKSKSKFFYLRTKSSPRPRQEFEIAQPPPSLAGAGDHRAGCRCHGDARRLGRRKAARHRSPAPSTRVAAHRPRPP